ncbi:AraC family transcriptional regulator [Cellulomonas sp. SG140]|uniref:AraC family transcriptional regulator n=1 Tax=Cellulomonas sp. SG140 TaxID=2976536 RepID=UPI0021E8F361|nr:helix-turn-helix transcriptional regulator [Cellulomonas sp. SG140]
MPAVQQLTYQPLGGVPRPVEVLTFDRLRELSAGGTQRADFHVVAVVDRGHGAVTVDFRRHRLGPRSAVWIPPGAVHRWDDIEELSGRLVLFVPSAPATPATRRLSAAPNQAPTWTVGPDWPLLTAALDHLELEAAAGPSELAALLLSALLLRLDPPGRDPEPDDSLFALFRDRVEEGFRTHRDAGYYARALGYAPRTLSRAVQRATGGTAKAYLTERVVLEAERLLAHDGVTAARCARELGFPDATSFSVFFRTATGLPPARWLAQWRDAPTGHEPTS